ncbi:lumazine synthase [Coemansia aciculifera]|uniref:Lumazine synthase n=1 Tax=Coemansia aciculifera TaxID=417176 RepID=A0ACC1LX42_9FUNG|nr:lumazine synthase [Coemansia aciculifera]
MGGDDFHKGVKEPSVKLNGYRLRILIVHTRWNSEIVDPLVEGTITALLQYGVQRDNIVVKDVPGAFELPGAAQRLIKQAQYLSSADSPPFNAAVCIGVLIKGSTMHFEYIADATANDIMRVGLETDVPVIFGVLTCLTEEQAMQRAGIGRNEYDRGHNHGADWGAAAVEMALLQL